MLKSLKGYLLWFMILFSILFLCNGICNLVFWHFNIVSSSAMGILVLSVLMFTTFVLGVYLPVKHFNIYRANDIKEYKN